MGKSSPSTQTTTTSESRAPWQPTVAPLKKIVQGTMDLATPAMFTPEYSAQTMAGLQGLENAAGQPQAGTYAQAYGNDVLSRGAPVGVDQLIATARGDNLNANPYLMQALQYTQDDVQDRINNSFAGVGRLGSGLNQRQMAEGLSRSALDAFGNDYARERGYQVNAADRLAGMGGQTAAMAGQLDQSALFPSQLMMDVGQTRDQMATAERMAPIAALDYQRGGVVPIAGLGGTSSGTSTTTMQAPKPSIPGMILGGGMMLGGLANGFGGFGMPGFGAGAGPLSGRWPY